MVAIDRDAALKKAEKFLRQGRLDQAIAEYLRIVKEQPRDWSTVNAAGDLLVRAGQVESAIEHFARIADHFFDEGFLPRAAAVYKKILKLKPDAEHALLRSAEISERQGLVADAKTALTSVADRRLKRGDRRGAAEIHLRLGALDPTDLATGVSAARAAAELGDVTGAVQRLLHLAQEFAQRSRLAESRQVLDEALKLDPENAEVRSALVARCMETGDLDRAADFATTSPEFKAIASEFYAQGKADEALRVFERALEKDPGDSDTRAQLVRTYITRGELDRARGFLTGEVGDPELLLNLAEIELRTGHLDEGRELASRVLLKDPTRREELVLLGCRLCEHDTEGAFQCIDVATDAAVADADWPAAASALHEYVTRVSGHIPALMKLVEVCVDGGLEATMYTAQAQLADAYLKAGRGNEARVIAEDLVAREPWEPANIERFRSALVMLGESDPDQVIAERLSGDSPFTSTDLALDFDLNEPPTLDQEKVETPPATAAPPPSAAYQPGPASIDLSQIFGKAAPPAAGPGNGDTFEIDLSDAVGDVGESPEGLEQVFEDFRTQAVRQGADAAGERLKAAIGFRDAGDVPSALQALEQAVRSPRHRFEAASMLARLHRDSGHWQDSIEWFERAAESAPASSEAARQLLYELGTLLADAGERDRALAVFLELQADAPDFRDVGIQVDRLSQKA
jgi:tetratricopeptide (TPR) repeat protein